jgi:hypothetical protein
MVKPGVYKVVWIPPAVTQDRVLNINLKGKTLDKKKLRGSWAFPVLAPLAQQVSIAANPSMLDLVQDEATTVTATLSGGAQGNQEGARLEVLSSTGQMGPFVPLGEGRYSSRYVKPAEERPHFSLVTTADLRTPGRTYGSLVIPLQGQLSVPIEGHAGGQALVQVGDRELGPFELNSKGKATVDLKVPPQLREVTVVAIKDGERSEQVVALDLPSWQRLRMVPGHRSIPADPELEVPVRVFVADAKGQPDGEASPQLIADIGQVTELKHEGAGIYAATWTPPASAKKGQATLRVRLESIDQEDSMEIALLPLRPALLELATVPDVLGESDREFKLHAQVTDSSGKGISGRELSLQLVGAKIVASPKDGGDGGYTSTLSAKGLAAEVLVTVKAPASQNPVQHVVILPTKGRLINDGLSSSMLTILTLDEFGYPVSDQDLEIQRVQGDGSIPETARTDSAGIAQVYYTAGRTPGVVQIQVQSAGHTAAVGLLQLPTGAAEQLTLPPSGSQTHLEMAAAWSAIVGFKRVEREGF